MIVKLQEGLNTDKIKLVFNKSDFRQDANKKDILKELDDFTKTETKKDEIETHFNSASSDFGIHAVIWKSTQSRTIFRECWYSHQS